MLVMRIICFLPSLRSSSKIKMSDEVVNGYAVYNYDISNQQIQLTNGSDVIGDGEPDQVSKDVSDHEDEKKLACRLSLLSSNMQAEQETCLRSFLKQRLERIQPLEGSGNISSIPTGKMYDKSAMVYFYLMNEEQSNSQDDLQRDDSVHSRTFLICFVATLEMGLELFHSELDKYCQSLGPYLHRNMESVDVSEYLKHLEAWYEINICFIQRCFNYLDNQLSNVIFASFLGEEITLTNLSETASRDIKSFMSCCSLSELLQDKSLKNLELCLSPRSPTRTLSKGSTEIVYENDEYKLNNAITNPFCQDCVKALKKVGLESPFKLRQVVETYKLKVIQDMNTFKRLSKQAETDYYALYRTYSFLISCDNGDILLKNAKVQCEDEENKGTKDILTVLQKFIEGKAGFLGIRNEDKSNLKAQYLLRLLNH